MCVVRLPHAADTDGKPKVLHRYRRNAPKKAPCPHRPHQRLKEQAKFIYQHRHLIVRRPETLTAQEQKNLTQMMHDAPSLGVVRSFVLEVYQLFERAQTEATAWRRHAAVLGQASYAAVPELAAALKLLAAAQLTKMIAFLRSRVGQRVRTNNHVERMNRVLRLYEKTRYKWRSARTKVRFVWLLVERRWGASARAWTRRQPGGAGKATRGDPQRQPSSPDPSTGEQRRIA
jgi:hypothetical protein